MGDHMAINFSGRHYHTPSLGKADYQGVLFYNIGQHDVLKGEIEIARNLQSPDV